MKKQVQEKPIFPKSRAITDAGELKPGAIVLYYDYINLTWSKAIVATIKENRVNLMGLENELLGINWDERFIILQDPELYLLSLDETP